LKAASIAPKNDINRQGAKRESLKLHTHPHTKPDRVRQQRRRKKEIATETEANKSKARAGKETFLSLLPFALPLLLTNLVNELSLLLLFYFFCFILFFGRVVVVSGQHLGP